MPNDSTTPRTVGDAAHPLRLAIGSHAAGSGKGCAMNLISWENGDTTITDLPACADPMLARIVQRVNDSLCTHRDGDLLCPSCSMVVLDLAHRTVGTSGHGLSPFELRRVWVRVAADQARQVMHRNTDPRVEAAIVAAERWADDPSEVNADAAYAAAAYAAADAYAAAAAYAAADAAYAAADAAYAAADAAAYAADADAADAAYAAAKRVEFAHRTIDTFIEHTGLDQPTAPTPDVVDRAAALMLGGAR